MRIGGALLLAIMVAALPTVVSLCALRCTARPVAASRTLPPLCHGRARGHEGKAPQSVPAGEHRDCAEHVLLAKGNGTGIEIQVDRTVMANAGPLGSFLVTSGQLLERGELAAADLSPPFGRSTDILRL
jgi:hypothetical protein